MPTSSPSRRPRMGNVSAMVRLMNRFERLPPDPVLRKRHMVADLCRLLGAQLGKPEALPPGLTPRLGQTLTRLLAGDGEKQVATQLGLSPHTVHVYVKALYRHFDVCSRGELLARFVRAPGGQRGAETLARAPAKSLVREHSAKMPAIPMPLL